MKMTFTRLLVALALFLSAAVSQAADIIDSGTCGANGNNVTWTLTDDGNLTISGIGAMKDLTLSEFAPYLDYYESIKTVTIDQGVTSIGNTAFADLINLIEVSIPSSVTSIGDYAFYVCEYLSQIDIPEGVTSIGNDAFWSCSSLSSITLPNSLTSIGQNVFRECSSLESISIPSSLTTIASGAFEGCSSLTSVSIPKEVTSIQSSAFYGCNSLSSIYLPDGITSIAMYTFSGCSSLSSIDIPESVTSIGDGAFSGCSSLTSIVIPNSVTSMGGLFGNVFSNCRSLTSITLPDALTSIGSAAFVGCSSLKSITLPSALTSIDYLTFGDCTSLTYLTIPDGVTFIGEMAFRGCTSLTSLTIPDKVTSIEQWTFWGCTSLTSLNIPDGITSIGYYAFWKCTSLSSLTIPSDVTSIGEGAFCECTSLTSLTIPDKVSSIKDFAFSECTSLSSIIVVPDNSNYLSLDGILFNKDQSILICYPGGKQGEYIIPSSVTSIGSGAFVGCSSLTSVIIPNSVTTIGEDAFSGCTSLTSVTIPNSVTSIGDYAFLDCASLTSVTNLATTPQKINSKVFSEVPLSLATLYVPAASIQAYKKANVWKNFGTILEAATEIQIAEGVESYENTETNTNVNITYTRNFTNTNWQALYVPFSISSDEWEDNFEVAYINGVHQYDDDEDGTIDRTTMEIIKIKAGTLIPNTPYLIKAKVTGEQNIVAKNATLSTTEDKHIIDCSTTHSTFTFAGTYATIPAADAQSNEYYAMGSGSLIKANGKSSIKPFRWYMTIESRNSVYYAPSTEPAQIRIRVVGEQDEAETHIYSIAQDATLDQSVFNLIGQSINKESHKGFQIKNGKLIFIK